MADGTVDRLGGGIHRPDQLKPGMTGRRGRPLRPPSPEADDRQPYARIASVASPHARVTLMAHRRPWSRALSVTPVARGAGSAFAVRVAGSACGFGSAVLLTRALGATGYGAYAWALAWTVALARPAGLGATLLLTRHVAAAELHDRPGSRLLATRVAGVVAVAAAVIALVVALVILVVRVADHQSETTLLVALPALPAAALIGIPQGVLQGLGRPGLGVLPATLLQQAPFLAVVLLAWGVTGGRLSPAFAGAA